MTRKKVPAISEILSAITVISTTAAIAAVLWFVVSEQSMNAEDVNESRGEVDMMRASELIVTSHEACSVPDQEVSFLLHNYARDARLEIEDVRAFVTDTSGGLREAGHGGFSWKSTSGTSLLAHAPPILNASSTAVVSYAPVNCETEMLGLITPGGEAVRVRIQ